MRVDKNNQIRKETAKLNADVLAELLYDVKTVAERSTNVFPHSDLDGIAAQAEKSFKVGSGQPNQILHRALYGQIMAYYNLMRRMLDEGEPVETWQQAVQQLWRTKIELQVVTRPIKYATELVSAELRNAGQYGDHRIDVMDEVVRLTNDAMVNEVYRRVAIHT